MRSQHYRAAFIVLACALAACESDANARELTGLYVMNKGRAADSLIVRDDSTYRHIYARPNSPVVVDSGRWSAVHRDGALQMEFSNFSSRWTTEMFPTERMAHGWFVVAATQRFGGAVRLEVDSDIGWAYVRQSPPGSR